MTESVVTLVAAQAQDPALGAVAETARQALQKLGATLESLIRPFDLAQPPLYRVTQGAKSVYAMNDGDRERKVKSEFKAGVKIDVSRFKGLGEMPPAQLRETTMDPAKRTLLKVVAAPEDRAATADRVESLMGRRPELRFQFIQDNAKTVEELDV